jgi:CheY-like chemotaxis protein
MASARSLARMILVVDDHRDSRYAVVRLLQRLGHDAVEAHGGREAIAYLRDHTPALIILDCNMPRVDGLDVVRFVRGEGRLADVAVVVYTADVLGDRRADFERLGVQGWIVKASTDWDQIADAANRFAARA